MPLGDLLPDHPPLAEQDVAFVDDQVSVAESFALIVEELVLSDTVGIGGGGGVDPTVTVTDFDVVPPVPVQLSE